MRRKARRKTAADAAKYEEATHGQQYAAKSDGTTEAYKHIQFRDVAVDVPSEAYDGLVESYPARCPIATAYMLRPYVRNKVFCDLGCGGGDLTWAVGEWAKKAIGIEYSLERAARWDSRESKRENVQFIQADYFESKIPAADVYFYWGLPEFLPRVALMVKKRVSKCLLVGACHEGFLLYEKDCKSRGQIPKRTKRGHLLEHVDRYGGYVLRTPVTEEAAVPEWSHKNNRSPWCLCIIPLKRES